MKTQSQFIADYCKESDVTEERLNEQGRFAFPCRCHEAGVDDGMCEGWQMTNADGVKHEVKMNRL